MIFMIIFTITLIVKLIEIKRNYSKNACFKKWVLSSDLKL